jgi:hypothetical protein
MASRHSILTRNMNMSRFSIPSEALCSDLITASVCDQHGPSLILTTLISHWLSCRILRAPEPLRYQAPWSVPSQLFKCGFQHRRHRCTSTPLPPGPPYELHSGPPGETGNWLGAVSIIPRCGRVESWLKLSAVSSFFLRSSSPVISGAYQSNGPFSPSGSTTSSQAESFNFDPDVFADQANHAIRHFSQMFLLCSYTRECGSWQSSA